MSIRNSNQSGLVKANPFSLASAMKRFSLGDGEAHFGEDKSMIVNNIEIQVKELEMQRDKLL